jgi:hypothetical protein
MMRFACYFAIAVCAFAGGAKASTITIDQGPPFIASYDNGGMGNGRGVSFLANQNFSITSMGVDLSVPASNSTNYVYQIYASTNGHDVGSLLSSVTFQLGAGNDYRDQAFNFNFSTGSYYVVNFARQDGQYLGNLGTHYVWEGASSAINYGPFTVVEGFEGAFPNNGNPLIPFTRFDVITTAVPEPSTWAMMLLGFAAVGFAACRRKQNGAQPRLA